MPPHQATITDHLTHHDPIFLLHKALIPFLIGASSRKGDLLTHTIGSDFLVDKLPTFIGIEAFARDFGSEWLEREKARILVNPTRALANGILNEHWRNGSGIEDIHAGGTTPPRPLTQCRLTRAQEALLMQETAELFVPTLRALYYVVSKPSEESWPEQALPYSLAFKPPADWSLDEQTREFALPGTEPQ